MFLIMARFDSTRMWKILGGYDNITSAESDVSYYKNFYYEFQIVEVPVVKSITIPRTKLY
jgi:hypothetical protein